MQEAPTHFASDRERGEHFVVRRLRGVQPARGRVRADARILGAARLRRAGRKRNPVSAHVDDQRSPRSRACIGRARSKAGGRIRRGRHGRTHRAAALARASSSRTICRAGSIRGTSALLEAPEGTALLLVTPSTSCLKADSQYASGRRTESGLRHSAHAWRANAAKSGIIAHRPRKRHQYHSENFE